MNQNAQKKTHEQSKWKFHRVVIFIICAFDYHLLLIKIFDNSKYQHTSKENNAKKNMSVNKTIHQSFFFCFFFIYQHIKAPEIKVQLNFEATGLTD